MIDKDRVLAVLAEAIDKHCEKADDMWLAGLSLARWLVEQIGEET